MENILENVTDVTARFTDISKEQYPDSIAYPNRIRFRDSSYGNFNSKGVKKLKQETVTAQPKEVPKTDKLFSVVDDISSANQLENEQARPIMLKEEKIVNLCNNVGVTISALSEKKELKEENKANTVADVNPIEEKNELPIDTVVEETIPAVNDISNEIKEVENVDNAEIDKVYEQIQKETEETLKAKDGALEAKKNVEVVRQEVQQRMEESDARVLEKSAEQAEMKARKEAAIRRNQEIERSIVAAFATQRQALTSAKERYLMQQQQTKDEINELNRRADDKARENDSKIDEFQKTIDKDREDVTSIENEIARKESILAALNNSMEFDTTDNQMTDTGVSYKK